MILEEFAQNYPLISIIVFTFLITLILTLIYKFTTNQQRIKELRDEQKKLQEQIKQEKDKDKLIDIQKEMLQKSSEMMKYTFKSMIITFIPVIIMFAYLKSLYANTGHIINWGTNIPIFTTGLGWFWLYLIFGIIFNITLRKMLKVY